MRETYEYHRSWILLLSGVLILLVGSPYLTSCYKDYFASQKNDLTYKRDRLAKQLKQWEKDNKTAIDISQTMTKEEIDNLLTPAGRNAMSAQIEPLAATARLGHVRYILSPPKPWDGGNKFPGIKKIVQSTLIIEADAPHDGDIYNFMDKLSALSGKFVLQKLTITPLYDQDSQTLSAYNLHFKATCLWLANEDDK